MWTFFWDVIPFGQPFHCPGVVKPFHCPGVVKPPVFIEFVVTWVPKLRESTNIIDANQNLSAYKYVYIYIVSVYKVYMYIRVYVYIYIIYIYTCTINMISSCRSTSLEICLMMISGRKKPWQRRKVKELLKQRADEAQLNLAPPRSQKKQPPGSKLRYGFLVF